MAHQQTVLIFPLAFQIIPAGSNRRILTNTLRAKDTILTKIGSKNTAHRMPTLSMPLQMVSLSAQANLVRAGKVLLCRRGRRVGEYESEGAALEEPGANGLII